MRGYTKICCVATLLLPGLSGLSGCESARSNQPSVASKTATTSISATGADERALIPSDRSQSAAATEIVAPPDHATEGKPPPGPTDPVTDKKGTEQQTSLTFDDLIDRADALAVDGKIDDAIEAYEAASARDPKSAVPNVEIARLLIKDKKTKRARDYAELAVELSPGWSTAWNTLGRVDLVARKLDDAAESFGRATEKNPANIYAWNNLGLVRIGQGRFDEAAEALEEATKSDDAVAYMFNNLGTSYERLGRTPEALVAYKRGLALGSSLAGKNFVRLEKKQDLERTAQRPEPTSDPAEPTALETDPS